MSRAHEILSFLLEANLCLLVWYLFYRLVLAKETFFRLNRWFLLLGVAVALGLPLLRVDLSDAELAAAAEKLQPERFQITPEKLALLLPPSPAPSQDTPMPTQVLTGEEVKQGFRWEELLLGLYLLGVFFGLSFVAYDLAGLLRLGLSQKRTYRFGYHLILTEGKLPTLSFFGWLFWDNTIRLSPLQRKQILRHEKVHMREYHSADVLLMQLLCVLCWWNPVVYLYRKAVKENHEYLADAQAKGEHSRSYALLLLEQTLKSPNPVLTNNFFQIPIKKRITMMSKPMSNRRSWKYALLLPVLLGLTLWIGEVKTKPDALSYAATIPNWSSLNLLSLPEQKHAQLPLDSPVVETGQETEVRSGKQIVVHTEIEEGGQNPQRKRQHILIVLDENGDTLTHEIRGEPMQWSGTKAISITRPMVIFQKELAEKHPGTRLRYTVKDLDSLAEFEFRLDSLVQEEFIIATESARNATANRRQIKRLISIAAEIGEDQEQREISIEIEQEREKELSRKELEERKKMLERELREVKRELRREARKKE